MTRVPSGVLVVTLAVALAVLVLVGCDAEGADGPLPAGDWTSRTVDGDRTGAVEVAPHPDEVHFRSLTQLTHGGTNAEAYFSAEGDRVIFQATWPGESECDQIYAMNLDGSGLVRVSTGEGRTTCGYFFPGEERVLFSSTHHVDPQCPTPPDRSEGYLWGLFPYDVFIRDLETGEIRQLTDEPGYDAEATISPDGSTIIFTSDRSGDLELWAMDADGSNPRQLTDEVGYLGGAFFSPDGSRIVYRAFHPRDEEELREYRDLLDRRLIQGGNLEIWVMDADGSNRRQVTDNGASNFAPFFHPDGERIIFSSNLHRPGGRGFSLYIVNADGTGLERVTWSDDGFDGFPMFSPDGRQLLFASTREGASPREINVFLAEWTEGRVEE
jgi:TolB protein